MLVRSRHHSILLFFTAILYGAFGTFASVMAAPPATDTAPTIALLLPLKVPALTPAARAVRDGFYAAAQIRGEASGVRVYPTGGGNSVLAAYRQAVLDGAQLVSGPLTHDGVSALAQSNIAAVPTLALNVPDNRIQSLPHLYFFSLSLENEARQVARVAYADGHRKALTVSTQSALMQRVQSAFTQQFQQLGGTLVAPYVYSGDKTQLNGIYQAIAATPADMAFLALDYRNARIVRPFLGSRLAVYATSQVNPGSSALATNNLNGVHFMDMPWLLEPDYAAAAPYPRRYTGSPDLERLYAFGIDAFRLSRQLLTGTPHTLDGVTGTLTLQPNRHFNRTLVAAEISGGSIVVHNESATAGQ
jgi:outer membrane PBP1 activator LpoA protein